MNTIIPSKLSFNLDLNDLPTRAVQLPFDALTLSGSCNKYFNARAERVFGGNYEDIVKYCLNACKRVTFNSLPTLQWRQPTPSENQSGSICQCRNYNCK
jgi:hypothetical protein